MVKKWLIAGEQYLKEMDLEDMAVLKICLLSMGTLVGLSISSKGKKAAAVLAGLLCVGTYVPLMSKFVELFSRGEYEEQGKCPEEDGEE